MARKMMVITFGLTASLAPILASAQSTTTTGTTSNGSSTGVGNAGSFGIASGTSNSTSTATSNGYQYSGTDNSLSIRVVSKQELQDSNVDTHIVVGGSEGGQPVFTTGSTSVSGGAFANYSGVLNNGWNTAPGGSAQAATNIAVNGNLSQR